MLNFDQTGRLDFVSISDGNYLGRSYDKKSNLFFQKERILLYLRLLFLIDLNLPRKICGQIECLPILSPMKNSSCPVFLRR